MSETMTKVTIRGIIPCLKDVPQLDAYTHFRSELGPPDDEDFIDGDLNWFYYDPKNHEFAPIHDQEQDQWGVETIVRCEPEYDFDPVLMDLEWIQSQCSMMEHRFGAKRFVVVAYNWYTGVDEPKSLAPTHKEEPDAK